MSDRWFNVPLGSSIAQNVVEGASDTAQFVAVRVTYDATGNDRLQFIRALEAVYQYAVQETWPPT